MRDRSRQMREMTLGRNGSSLDLIAQFASCFHDYRRPEWIEHEGGSGQQLYDGAERAALQGGDAMALG